MTDGSIGDAGATGDADPTGIGLRDDLPIEQWYEAPARPKPIRDRWTKLARLRELGFEPYAYGWDSSHDLTAAREAWPGEGEGPTVRVAGRIESLRDMGKSAFLHLGDRNGRLQAYFKRQQLSERDAQLLDLLDLGDWIGVEGPLFETRTGEVTVRADRLTLLSKSLRPLPYGKVEVDETGERIVHSGFADTESRYRQRYADLAVNPEVREIFLVRARVIASLRRRLDESGFIEVETPILQPLYGGAFARPFTTHHNTLDRQLYLRIADELYLKRLIVGSLDRVYEIGKNFRNEGIDRTHNPEFTMLELYQALADYETMMDLAESLVSETAKEIVGGNRIEWDGHTVDLSPPWERVTFFEAIERHAGFDARAADMTDLAERLQRAGRDDADSMNRTRLLDAVFSEWVEPELVDPTIIYDYPIEMSPLAKPKRGDPELAERFEVIVAGTELVNAFSELNDPLDQWKRFAEQARARAGGDAEAQGLDRDYVRALEYGLPPTGGLGLGIDRLVMLLTGKTTIREVILYPILREEEI
ncbi:MAG: lysine--tRNA ligase [marine benthic group bacterium]|jgi:lysyl-tRNA synthetase class 2|nr:lysine--tRNA ligase [Candidatus Carthagonibacter metallireducens]MCL7989861.1 lysine--tRNA ligase [Gemmatimonadota bacterium]